MSRHVAPQTRAFVAGVAAFTTWGLVPIYWKLLRDVAAPEILAHRFVWSVVFLGGMLSWQRRWPEVIANFRSRRTAIFCLGSGIAVGLNWLLFIWAVNIGRVLETSLGYFTTPIVNVLLGAIVLREKLSHMQICSIVIAFAGVLTLTFGYGHFPMIAVCLCLSFGVYGLLRKQSRTAAIPGLFLETTYLLPLALIYLVILGGRAQLIFGPSHLTLSALLLTTGVVTALPLVWFGHAARHLRLVTIGFLQYLSPSLSFLLALFVYHETFTVQHFVTFVLIWIALALVSTEALLQWRSRTRRPLIESSLIEPSV